MKNVFKLAFVALTLATIIAACGGESKKENDTLLIDSNAMSDTTIKVDSNTTDTAAVDSGAKM